MFVVEKHDPYVTRLLYRSSPPSPPPPRRRRGEPRLHHPPPSRRNTPSRRGVVGVFDGTPRAPMPRDETQHTHARLP